MVDSSSHCVGVECDSQKTQGDRASYTRKSTHATWMHMQMSFTTRYPPWSTLFVLESCNAVRFEFKRVSTALVSTKGARRECRRVGPMSGAHECLAAPNTNLQWRAVSVQTHIHDVLHLLGQCLAFHRPAITLRLRWLWGLSFLFCGCKRTLSLFGGSHCETPLAAAVPCGCGENRRLRERTPPTATSLSC